MFRSTASIVFIVLIIIHRPPDLGAMEYDAFLENTLIAEYDDNQDAYVLNRLRLNATLGDESFSDFSFNLIVDNQSSYYGDSDLFTDKLEIHRAYLEYFREKHLVIIGKQRVFFGVGRLWNPIDVFNPVEALAIEPEERQATESLRYEYAVSELSQLTVVASAGKYAARIKGFMKFADLALVGVRDEDDDRDIFGWEAEGELLKTGVELRSEGGLIHDRESDEYHVEMIIGAEYGFANSLTVLGEFFYNDFTHVNYLGLSGSYRISMLLSLQLQAMANLSDHSLAMMLSSEYSLSDEMGLSGGLLRSYGGADDEFGDGGYCFFRWFIHI